MEVFDVVNEKDEVIGQATREECHSNPDLIHRTVHFTLVDKQSRSVLITQRSYSKKKDGGLWCFAGEHILVGETYEQAVRRGLKEEFGTTAGEIQEGAHRIFSYDTQREFVRFFLCFWEGAPIVVDRREIIDQRWLSCEDLYKDFDSYSQMTQYWLKNVDFKSLL